MAHSGSPIRCRWSMFCWAVSRSALPMDRPKHTRSTWPGCCSKTLRPRARSGPASSCISAAGPSAPNGGSPFPTSPGSGSRVTAAVERALDDRQREATEEVERILAAAVRVMERVAPEPPRVSDIVAEAGSSNKAFYRYFAGKDDLILAVMERGVGIVVSYLQHQMAKEGRPADKIARWIEGTLAQVSDPHLVRKSRAAAGQMSTGTNWRTVDQEMMWPLRDLLTDPVAALASSDVNRD